ncbi:hypothetical protein AB4Y72_15340 [Arthrobacter sp. YAF34]
MALRDSWDQWILSALLIIGGLETKSPDRNPDVDRVPATFIVSQAPSKLA